MCLAIPGKIIAIQEGTGVNRRGTVDFEGTRQNVSLAYLPSAQIGDYILAHVGFAITQLDTAAAERTLQEIRDLRIP